MDVLEDAVELFERVIADDYLALAGSRVLHLHLGAKLVRQVAFEFAGVRIARRALVFAARRGLYGDRKSVV